MRVFIVDDHPLARKGIISVLSLEADMDIVGEAACVKDAVDGISSLNPELALIDLKLDNECGLEIIKAVQSREHSCKFIVLTSSSDHENFKIAEKMNVDGYILKSALPEEIVYGIKMVLRNRKYYDPEIMQYILREKQNDMISDLTEREVDVLMALGKGMSNKEIAKELFITEYTVKKHVSQILSKLALEDRTQAALYANSRGLVRYQ